MNATYASDEYLGPVGHHTPEDNRLERVFSIESASAPITSSGKKLILKGHYTGQDKERVAACALVFMDGQTALFGTECANLGMCSTIGVGPNVLDIMEARIGDEAKTHPIIIEEDVGESLDKLLRLKARGSDAPVLHPLGTPERELENAKIAFDVFSQVINAHRENLYHCDLRCENVCVRRFGTRPEDIRATIIDVELSAGIDAGRPARKASLYDTLFRIVPTHLAHGTPGTETKSVIVPSPLEMDMGYLAALLFHVSYGDTALNDRHATPEVLDAFVSFVERAVPFFGYDIKTMTLVVRRLDEDQDLRPIATQLGLKEVSKESFPTEALFHEAQSFRRLYLDGSDIETFKRSAVWRMHQMIDALVHVQFERYKEMRRAQGKPVEYDTIESQPEDLITSNYDQMAHVLTKVHALGYETAELASEAEGLNRISALSDEQVEILARMEHARWVKERLSKGWTPGERNPEAKTSPYLIPYDMLTEDVKEYDRDVARNVIGLLEMVGVAVIRPS